MTDPNKDEHIEELLGKLQGIFGKLSHSEEEEAQQKIESPAPAPKEKPFKKEDPPAAPLMPPSSSIPKPAPSAPIKLYPDPIPAPPPPSPPPPSVPAPSVIPIREPAAATPPPPAPAAPPQGVGAYESSVPAEDPERMIVPTAVYFPIGREAEAKSLAQKLETMTPRFTKVAFRLRVCVFLTYDPKSDWKEAILAKAAEIQFKTAFVAMDRPLEDARRKAIAAELEERNIYFQEITLSSIEKKAIYTDILLGLVFFFDSRKPPANADET